MSELPMTLTIIDATPAPSEDVPQIDPPAKTWDDYETCQQCKGHAQIDETADGDLECHVCRCKFPRPSS